MEDLNGWQVWMVECFVHIPIQLLVAWIASDMVLLDPLACVAPILSVVATLLFLPSPRFPGSTQEPRGWLLENTRVLPLVSASTFFLTLIFLAQYFIFPRMPALSLAVLPCLRMNLPSCHSTEKRNNFCGFLYQKCCWHQTSQDGFCSLDTHSDVEMPVERAARHRLVSGPTMGAACAVRALLVPPKPSCFPQALCPSCLRLHPCACGLFFSTAGNLVVMQCLSFIFKPAQYCEEIIILLNF